MSKLTYTTKCILHSQIKITSSALFMLFCLNLALALRGCNISIKKFTVRQKNYLGEIEVSERKLKVVIKERLANTTD